ncbi:Uncharacterised protein [Shigella sonnei]|nr:Uncharacterised protein [Shigella sonnei]
MRLKMLMKLRAYAMSGGKRNYPSSPMAWLCERLRNPNPAIGYQARQNGWWPGNINL